MLSVIRVALCLLTALAAANERAQLNAVHNLFQPAEDPDAEIDTFARLSSKHRSIWEGTAITIPQLRSQLEAMKISVVIEVITVGLDGTGAADVKLKDRSLNVHLQHLMTSYSIQSLGFPDANETEKDEGMSIDMWYHLIEAKKSLARNLEKAITSHIKTHRSIDLMEKDFGIRMIPYDVVDELIRQDYDQGHVLPAVYVLNPNIQLDQSYAYQYDNKFIHRLSFQSGSVFRGQSCPGTFWSSSGNGKGLYIWMDITAGPPKYGPKHVGSGQVMEHSFPRVGNYPSKIRNDAIVPDLAATIHSAVQHLLVPHSLSLKLREWKKINVKIIHIHDALIPDVAEMHIKELQDAVDQLRYFILKGQSISFHHHYLAFGKCDACTAAFHEFDICSSKDIRVISRALMVGSGRVPGPGVVIEETEFLDADVLHSWFSLHEVQDSLKDNSDVEIDLISRKPHEWTLPVFIFELAKFRPLAFEDGKQAVGFSNMVVGVRTHYGKFTSDMTCAGHDIQVLTPNVTRPLLASLLQTSTHSFLTSKSQMSVVWGVVETSEVWSPIRGRMHDYRWSVGPTPFGHLSDIAKLPNSLQHVARRNYLLSVAFQLIQRVKAQYDVLEKLSSNGSPSDIFNKDDRLEFYLRSNVFRSKLTVGLTHAGHGEFDLGQYYIRSGRHDVEVLEKLTKKLRESGPQPMLCCKHRRGKLNFFLCGLFGMGLALILWILRCLRPVKVKYV